MKRLFLLILFVIIVCDACAPLEVAIPTATATSTILVTSEPAITSTPISRMWQWSNSLVGFYDMTILPNHEVWAIDFIGFVVHDYVELRHLTGLEHRGDYDTNRGGFAINFVSPNDGWMTGKAGQIFHWNGEKWEMADLPETNNNIVWRDIRFASTNAGWVIGCDYKDPSNGAATIMYWDGDNWGNVSLIDDIGRNNFCLHSLDIISSTNAWAVGGTFERGVILNWDGTKWNEISPPENLRYAVDISALGNADVWVAVENGYSDAVIFHWNGFTWKSTNLPISFTLDHMSKGVAILALSPNDVWAGGRGLFHWNGKEWKDTAYDARYGFIVDIEKASDETVWALTNTGIIMALTNN